MKRNQISLTAALLLCLGLPAMAQIDLSGSWASKNHEDGLERGAGPNPGDFTGIPFNESGRAKALSASQSELSMPERICAFYSQWHMMIGTFGVKIWNETDSVTGKTVAWVVGAWEDRAAMTIWMDGRPHPSEHAPHSQAGFTTGTWDGNVLTAYTTHMLTGYLRRNGVMTSAQATMTTHFIRHGDMLTLASQLEDPIYLTEPYYITRSFVTTTALMNSGGPPCIPGDEGVAEGTVPHYLPGKNPLLDELPRLYHIPREAALGGAETMYPAFREKLKDKFTIPPKCTRNCGVPPPGQN
jgi:heme-degrading monooxygenase HmoA